MTDSFIPLAEFEEKLRAALRTPEPEPAYVENLLRRVRQSPSRPKKTAWLRPSLAYAALTAIVITAVFLLVGPPKVLAAVRDWLGGYVPGFGFVNQDTELRVIPASVHQERDGAALTIDQAFADMQRTVIVIGEARYSHSCPVPVDPASGMQVREPYLMAGNDRLDLQNWQASYLTFPPLSAQVDEVVLYMPFQMFCDSGVPDWAVPLSFEPALEGTVIPVLEADPLVATDNSPASQIQSEAELQPSVDQVSIRLENVVELQDSILFSGLMSWSGENSRFSPPSSEDVTLQDGNGRSYSLEPLPDQEVSALYPTRPASTLPWAYLLAGKTPSGPLSLHFPYLLRTSDILADQGTFMLYLGSNPALGQIWHPALTVQAGDRTLHLTEVRALSSPVVALSFTFETEANVRLVALADVANLSGGGGTFDVPAPGQVVSTLIYSQALPTGERTFQIVAIEERVKGPWIVTWSGSSEP